MPETLNLLFNGIYLSSIHSVQHRQYKSLANFRSFFPLPFALENQFCNRARNHHPSASSSTLFTPKLRNYVIKLHPQRVGGAEIELIAVNLQNGLAEKLERTNSRNTRPRGENPFAGVSICIGQRVVFLTRSLPSPFIHFRSLCLPLSRALLVHDFSGFHASKVGFAGDQTLPKNNDNYDATTFCNLSPTGFLVTILANHDSIPPFNGEYFSNGVQVNFTECFETSLSFVYR